MKHNNVMIAMSGGVDSAAAALLVSKQAKKAAGVTMHLTGEASVQEDIAGAQQVCSLLQIPHYVAGLQDEFRRFVIDPFIKAYESGLTPNPCIFCNKSIKFGALLDFALKQGFDQIATGHYIRTEQQNERTLLRRAVDTSKDQTYMLWSLTQDVLKRCVFPLGELSKAEARELAEANGFPMARKKDSQDICFVPDGDYAAFIKRTTGHSPMPGQYVDKDGNVLGIHQGQLHYTIGQRKGLGIALGRPAFVTAKSAVDNTVTLGENEDLFTNRVIAKNINFIPFDRLRSPMKLLAKARYRQEASPARVEQIDDGTLIAEFEAPQRAVCPGQSLVLYDGDYLVGGGFIC